MNNYKLEKESQLIEIDKIPVESNLYIHINEKKVNKNNESLRSYLRTFEERNKDINLKILPVQISKQTYTLNFHSEIKCFGKTYSVNLLYENIKNENKKNFPKFRYDKKMFMTEYSDDFVIEKLIFYLRYKYDMSNYYVRLLNKIKELPYVHSVHIKGRNNISFEERIVVVSFEWKINPEKNTCEFPLIYKSAFTLDDLCANGLEGNVIEVVENAFESKKRDYLEYLELKAWEENIDKYKLKDFVERLELKESVKCNLELDRFKEKYLTFSCENVNEISIFDKNEDYYCNINKFKEKIKENLEEANELNDDKLEKINILLNKINECKNNCWFAKYDNDRDQLKIVFNNGNINKVSHIYGFYHFNNVDLQYAVCERMNSILFDTDNTYRLMEVM